MLLTSNIQLHEKLRQWSKYLVVVVLLIAILVLSGWVFNIDFIKRPVPHLVAMNPTSAMVFVFAGLSFLLFTSKKISNQKSIAAKILAVLVLTAGILKIIGIIINRNIPVDQLLFSGKLKSEIISNASNHMAPNTAFSFMLLGISLLLLKLKIGRTQRVFSHFPALLIALLAFLSILGYLYQVQAFYSVLVYIPMAIHTAACFLFFSIAILFANPDKGIMKEFTSPFTGSITARMLIPAAIIIPSVFGLLRLWAAWTNILPFEMGTALLILSIIIFFMGLIWYNVSLLNKRDFQSRQSEAALHESEAQIQTIFNSAPDAVIMINQEGTIVKWNPKAEILFGWKAEEVTGMLLSETIIPHCYRESHKKGIKHFLQTGEGPVLGKAIEIHALNKNNVEFDVALSISPTLVNNKYLFIGFIRDITEQKKIEEQIKVSNKRFTTVFNISPVAITINGEDRKFMYVNDAFCEISGFNRDEVIGKTSAELNIVGEEEQSNRVKQVQEAGGKAKGIEIKIRKANGEIIDVINSIERIEIDNKMCWVSTFIDITEQKKAEQKFKGLLEAAPDAIVIANEKGEIVLINQQTENLFGYPRHELIGKPVEILIPLDFRNKHIGHRTHYFSDPKVRSMGVGLELFALRKNGTQFPVEISLSPLVTEEGTLISASVRDITNRKKAEEKFRGLLEAAPDAIVIANEKGEIVLINQQTETLFGYPRHELIGKPVEILLPLDFKKRHEGHRTKYFSDPKVRSMGAGLELFAQRQDGTQFPVEISLSPLATEEGTLVSASVRDITDRKLAENQIQKQKQGIQDFIDSMSTLCAKLTTEGKLLMVNKTALLATGLSIQELLSTNFLEGNWWTFDAEVHTRVHNAFKKACSGITINYDENIFVFGQVLTINFSLTPILAIDGSVDYIVAEGRDITSLKLTEAALKKGSDQLEAVNKELEAFSYSVSHDLRAPLRIIDGYSEMLVSDYQDKLDDEGKRMFGIITGNVRKMGQLIDDLLNLSQTGRKELALHRTDMNTLVSSVIDEQLFLTDNRHDIKIEKLEPAECDSSLLRQVWSNLIANAIKYSQKQEKQVIRINSFIQNGEVVYAIKDNGVGFDMKYAGQLFGVFQRLHKVTEFEGTGVGLALVKRIVIKHGGRVWAEAEAGKGATFFFSLPVVDGSLPA
jgi:PAS domain S-box-containing protein